MLTLIRVMDMWKTDMRRHPDQHKTSLPEPYRRHPDPVAAHGAHTRSCLRRVEKRARTLLSSTARPHLASATSRGPAADAAQPSTSGAAPAARLRRATDDDTCGGGEGRVAWDGSQAAGGGAWCCTMALRGAGRGVSLRGPARRRLGARGPWVPLPARRPDGTLAANTRCKGAADGCRGGSRGG